MTPTDKDQDASAQPETGTGPAVRRPATAPPVRADTSEEEQGAAAPSEEAGSGAAGTLPDGVRQRVESWVPEMVKKAVAAGLGAVFTTEESIRRITKEMPMPKEVAGYLVNTASSTKDELFRIVAREVREFLSDVNLSQEIAKMLTSLSFEIKTEIRFIPNSEKYTGVEPDVKARVRLKRSDARPRSRMFRRREPHPETPPGSDDNEE